MTAFQALVATRGQWRPVSPGGATGQVSCPVCGVAVCWPDWSRVAHLRRHLRAGWRPGGPTPAPEAA